MSLRTTIATALAATTVLAQCMMFAPTAYGQDKVEVEKLTEKIYKAANLAAGSKVAIHSADKQAIVTVYSDTYAKADAWLIKVDGVLIAKCTFDAMPELVRVKVAFGTLRALTNASGYLNQVSISKGDIKAFGAKQLSKDDLLASMEITAVRPTDSPTSVVSTAAAAPVQKQDQLDVLTVSETPRGAWAQYRNAKTGLSVSHPARWKVIENPDKDTLFQIVSPTSTISFCQNTAQGIPLQQAVRLWEEFVFAQLPDYKLLAARRIRFGRNHMFEGISRFIEFKSKDVLLKQRWLFFTQSAKVFHIAITTPAGAGVADIPTIHQILMTLTFTGGTQSSELPRTAAGATSNATASNHSQSQHWTKFSLFQQEGITLNYPSDWQIKMHNDAASIAKFSGATSEGSAEIEIRKSASDKSVSLEDTAIAVENNFFKTLKNYHRVRMQPASAGAGGASGIFQEVTFEASGLPFRQLCIYRREGDHLYTLSLTACGWKQNDMLTLFNRILGTWSIRE